MHTLALCTLFFLPTKTLLLLLLLGDIICKCCNAMQFGISSADRLHQNTILWCTPNDRPTDTHKYTQCALIDVYAHTAQYTTKKKKNPCKKYSKHLLRQPMLSPFIESGCTHTIECSLHKINCNRSIARTILNRTISGRYEIRVELSSAIGTDN